MSKTEYATVVQPRVPDNEDELELCVGDIIKILQKFTNGWLKGTIDDIVGVFPASHVKILKPLFSVRVVYKYEAQMPDELNLNVDDVISVLDDDLEDAGWWFGEMGGVGGMFPNNFVERIKQNPQPVVLNQAVIRRKVNQPPKNVEPSVRDVPKKDSSHHSNDSESSSDPITETRFPPNPHHHQQQQHHISRLTSVTKSPSNAQPNGKSQMIPKNQFTSVIKQHITNHSPHLLDSPETDSIQSQGDVNELKEDLAKIRFNFEWFSMKHAKTISQLVEEVEQEKKERKFLESELQELKKAIAGKFSLKMP